MKLTRQEIFVLWNVHRIKGDRAMAMTHKLYQKENLEEWHKYLKDREGWLKEHEAEDKR